MPDWKKEIGERLAGLKLEVAREAEILDELSQHLEDRYQELTRAGATREEAYQATQAELGDRARLLAELRHVESSVKREPVAWGAQRGGNVITELMYDVRNAFRSLVRARWFTIGAALTFALGIGVNVAVFSSVDRMLFRALPYDHPEQIFQMGEYESGTNQTYSSMPASYVIESRHLSGVVDSCVAAFTTSYSTSREPGDEPRIGLTSVSFNTLTVFGVRPFMGRDFTKEDAKASRGEALISYDLWRERFNGAPDIIGRLLWVEDRSVEIIGVLPAGFIPASGFLDPTSSGLSLGGDTLESAAHGARLPRPYLRLKSGVSSAAAEAEINSRVEHLKETETVRPGAPKMVLRLVSLRTALFGFYKSYLWLIVAAAALVLIVACANLASLLLVRARSREHQAVVRVALGASTSRLMRTAVVESLMLSFGGTLMGLLVLVWASKGLAALIPPVFSRYAAPVYDARVIGFSILAATLSALLAGILPCLRLAKVNVSASLQHTAGRGRGGRLRGGRSLLAVESAVSVVLVAGAMMTAGSLIDLVNMDVGFKPEALYSVRVGLPPAQDAQTSYQQYMQVLEVIRDLHGVNQASAADVLPISGFGGMARLGAGFDSGFRWQVTNGFFETVGMRVIAGRTFSSADLIQPGKVGILSQMGLHLVWPGIQPAEAVGRMLEFPGEAPRQVIGVVSDVRSSYARAPSPSLYLPVSPERFRLLMYVARAQNGAAPSSSELLNRVRERIATPIFISIVYLPDQFSSGLLDQRFRTVLFSTFGFVALLLAAIGLYAVGSYDVATRRFEMGVRFSLGATPSKLQFLVIREALTPVIVGILAGLIVTYWGAKFLQSFLYQVDAREPLTYIVVALVLIATAVMAAWLPARRAARTDPATVLRAE